MKITNKNQFLEEYLEFIGPSKTKASETLLEASKPISVMQFQAKQELERKIVLLNSCKETYIQGESSTKQKTIVQLIENQMKLASGQIHELERKKGANVANKYKEVTIEEYCLEPFVLTGKDGGKSEFNIRAKQFKLSDKKRAMIKIRGLVERKEIKELLAHVKKVNKKGEYVPYDIIFEYLESIGMKNVSDFPQKCTLTEYR